VGRLAIAEHGAHAAAEVPYHLESKLVQQLTHKEFSCLDRIVRLAQVSPLVDVVKYTLNELSGRAVIKPTALLPTCFFGLNPDRNWHLHTALRCSLY